MNNRLFLWGKGGQCSLKESGFLRGKIAEEEQPSGKVELWVEVGQKNCNNKIKKTTMVQLKMSVLEGHKPTKSRL